MRIRWTAHPRSTRRIPRTRTRPTDTANRDQGGFGHDRGESDGEAEGEQQPQGPAAGELVGEVLAHREHAQVQALEEQGDPHPHDQQSGDQL
ncbi:hypothetical protein GCM10009831_14940 [Dietzia cercidiphylli]|uniref:Uncharacterized protein n=1 Tax=Dietzia cercidiphylli TaxID=498199 RepID=A0ABN2IJW5_9ACTN